MYSTVSRTHLRSEYYRVYRCVHIYVIAYRFSPHVTPRKGWTVVTWKRRVKPRDRDLATKITQFLAHTYEQINCATIFPTFSAYSFLMLKNIFSFKEICKRFYCYAWLPFFTYIYILYIYIVVGLSELTIMSNQSCIPLTNWSNYVSSSLCNSRIGLARYSARNI